MWRPQVSAITAAIVEHRPDFGEVHTANVKRAWRSAEVYPTFDVGPGFTGTGCGVLASARGVFPPFPAIWCGRCVPPTTCTGCCSVTISAVAGVVPQHS